MVTLERDSIGYEFRNVDIQDIANTTGQWQESRLLTMAYTTRLEGTRRLKRLKFEVNVA